MKLVTDKPKIFVTGLSGLIGSSLEGALGKRYELIAVERRRGTDVTDRKALDAALDAHPEANVLVHLAAFTDVSRAHGQTGDKSGPCYKINVVGTENIVKACAARKIHLIHFSTDFVFDGKRAGAQSPYRETEHAKPIEWYGKTKMMSEDAVRRSRNWTIVRVAFPYTAGPAPKVDLVQSIYRKLLKGEEAHLFTDQIITPTFCGDIAQGIGLLARLRPESQLFHLVGSSFMTPFDMGLKIARAFNFDQRLVRPSLLKDYMKKDPRPRQERLMISNAKWNAFAHRHGLHSPLTFDAGLAKVVLAQPVPEAEPETDDGHAKKALRITRGLKFDQD